MDNNHVEYEVCKKCGVKHRKGNICHFCEGSGIQPMTAPTGKIFKMKLRSGKD